MFSFFKNIFTSFYDKLRGGLSSLFSRTVIDEAALQELEKLLLQADVGSATTRVIIERVKKQLGSGNHDGAALKKALEAALLQILDLPGMVKGNEASLATSVFVPNGTTPDTRDERGEIHPEPTEGSQAIYLLVGINGSGKTTAAAKLAESLRKRGEKVLLVAADTFRAAGASQLQTWAQRLKIDCVTGQPNQDPASVIYAGAQQFKDQNYTALIVDTAGRLQTKSHLMKELEKMKRVLNAQLPGKAITTLLTIDAMLGQNSFDQAKLFHESMALDGLILTKCDGSAKGGIIFALADQLKLPVLFITFGESIDSIEPFTPQPFVARLMDPPTPSRGGDSKL